MASNWRVVAINTWRLTEHPYIATVIYDPTTCLYNAHIDVLDGNQRTTITQLGDSRKLANAFRNCTRWLARAERLFSNAKQV